MDRIHLSSPSNTYTADSSDTPYNTDEREGEEREREREEFQIQNCGGCMLVHVSASCQRNLKYFENWPRRFPCARRGFEGDDYVNSVVYG